MDVKEIGNRIKQARTLRNLTLDDIANEIGVAKSTVQRYENGLINKPKLPVIQSIAESLKVNPVWLIEEEAPMIIEERLNNILKHRLDEIHMTLEEVSQKANVPLYWLQNIDDFIPGELGDYEIGYDWITQVATVIEMSPGVLRAALAKQEIPAYDGPQPTLEEVKKIFEEMDRKERLQSSKTVNMKDFQPNIKAVEKYMKILNIKGQDKVVDYAKDLSENPVYRTAEPILKAAHNDNADDTEEQRLMAEDLKDMEDNW